MGSALPSREQFAQEARAVLQALRENERAGRSNKLADVKGALEGALSTAFESYYAYLRRNSLLVLDRQASLRLTPDGERMLEEPGAVLASAPELPEVFGEGPLSRVFRGTHSVLSIEIATKELKDLFGAFRFLDRGEVSHRLQRVLKAQAAVRHPTIVPILDHACDSEHPRWVMEFCPGGNLRTRLRDFGAHGFELRAAVRLFLQAVYGLRAAHGQGLVHGNLKPENLLFDRFGNLRLADFGLAHLVPVFFPGSGIAYRGPEQLTADGAHALTPASDVYAMGVLLYELVTGRLPARRSPPLSAANPLVPRALDDAFERMCEDRVDARFPDFDAVLDAVYGAFSDGRFLGKGDLILDSPAIG